MRRYQRIAVFTVVNVLAALVLSYTVYAQGEKQLIDFRVRASYTDMDLAEAIFPEGGKGIGPATAAQPESAVALKVYFEFNSANIMPEYYKELDKLGRVLTLPRYEEYQIRIEGHTDNIGSDRYNQALSERRAESVRQYLVQHFQIRSDRLNVKGYGKNQPVETNATSDGREKNRRIEVVNLGR